MGWKYLSISKLQRLHRWSLGMDKQFHPTIYNGCNYLSMPGLKFNHVSKRGPWWHVSMGLCMKDVAPMLTHWSYLFLALKPSLYALVNCVIIGLSNGLVSNKNKPIAWISAILWSTWLHKFIHNTVTWPPGNFNLIQVGNFQANISEMVAEESRMKLPSDEYH